MSKPNENNGFESDIAEFEETMPSSPTIPSPSQGSTIPPSDPLTFVTHITPVATASPNPDPVPVDEGSPVLKHIATIALQAEETVRTMTQDMDMSTVAFIARASLGNSLQSLLDLHLLNTQFQHVFNFATSSTVLGYLDGITPGQLEAVIDDNSHLHQSMVAVAIKARLFAKCNKRRVKHLKNDMVTTLVRLEDSVHRFVWKMEEHLGRELAGWKEVLELVKFARAAWEEVVV